MGPDGNSVVIPAFSLHQALIGGAKKGRLKPVAAKKSVEVLHARLSTGIMIPDDAQTDMKLSAAIPPSSLATLLASVVQALAWIEPSPFG